MHIMSEKGTGKMTHSEVITLNVKLSKVKGLKGADLNYAIKKNLKKLKPEIEVYVEQEKDIQDTLKGFFDAQKVLSETYGDPIPEDKKAEHTEKLEALKTEHKETIDAADLKWKELMESRTKGESDFEPFTIKRHHIPADISTEDMDLIFDLIRDSEQ